MVAFDEKPTPEMVKQRREHLIDLWDDAHRKFEKIDDMIFRKYAVWPAEFRERPFYRPARSTAVLDQANDNQMAFTPSIKRYPHSQSEQSKERADRIEPFLVSVFEEASLLEPSLTFKASNRHLLAYGYTVVEGPLLSTMDRPTKPKRSKDMSDEEFDARMVWYENEKRTWMPFRIRAPHPSTVLLDPLEKKPSVAIVHRNRYAHELVSLIDNRKTTKGVVKQGREVGDFSLDSVNDNPFKPIMCDEVFTPSWHGLYTVDGDLIFLEKNLPRFVPYGHAFSGWGQVPTENPNVDNQGLNPAHMAVGIIEAVMDSLIIHAQAHSAAHNALIERAFPRRATSGSANDLQVQESRGDATLEMPKGKDSLWYLDTPDLPEWLFRVIQLAEQDIEQGTFSKILAGFREAGVVTVGQQAINSTAAARKFIGPIKQSEHLATNVAVNILRLIDVLGEEITVQGNSLKPSDIDHDYSVRVRFELIDPVLQMQERQTAMNEHASGLLSQESYWDRTRLEDVSGERRRLDEEAARNLPEVQRLRQRQVLREWGLLEEIERMEMEEAAALAAQSPTGGGSSGSIPQGLTPSVPGQPRTGQALADISPDRPL